MKETEYYTYSFNVSEQSFWWHSVIKLIPFCIPSIRWNINFVNDVEFACQEIWRNKSEKKEKSPESWCPTQ